MSRGMSFGRAAANVTNARERLMAGDRLNADMPREVATGNQKQLLRNAQSLTRRYG